MIFRFILYQIHPNLRILNYSKNPSVPSVFVSSNRAIVAQTKHFGRLEKHSSPVLQHDEIIQEFRNIEGEGQPKNCETIAGKKDV